jgi:hypothetical protein
MTEVTREEGNAYNHPQFVATAMEVDPPVDTAFPFQQRPGTGSASNQIVAPVLSKEQQDLKDLAAYFPAFHPGRPVNFTDLLGYGGEIGGGGQVGQYMEDPVGDQNRRRKIVDLDGGFDG